MGPRARWLKLIQLYRRRSVLTTNQRLDAGSCACPNLEALAATAVTNADPFTQAARALTGRAVASAS